MPVLPVLFFVLGVSLTSAQDANCDYRIYVQPGVTYDIRSPNYPASYGRGVTCRWIMTCPSGYNCRLNCPEVQLTPNCVDQILVSQTGDEYLYDPYRICGNNGFSALSLQQKLSLGLISSNSSTGGRFRCELYAQTGTAPPTCSCGERKENRIVGGQETGVNEYRMMAALISVRNAALKCGAVIISDRHVATAAHCMIGETTDTVFVLVGDHNLSTGAETNTTMGYRIESFTNHPQFNQANYNYDISILTIKQIYFNNGVGPVCMPLKYVNTDFAGSKVIVLGWGTTSPGGPTSKVLQSVVLDVISQARCRASVPNVTDNQMCTYTPGKDACQFDSGGPLIYTDGRNYFLAGLVSYGQLCASTTPSVNTRITKVLDWIIATTKVNFCRK